MGNREKTVLVTGASGGIGEMFARLFGRDLYNLVLVARNQSKLDVLARELELKRGIKVTAIALDLSSPTAAGKLYSQLEKEGIEIDILINNAGFGYYGPFVDMKSSKLQQMMQLNMGTLTQLAYLFGQRMQLLGRGKILNVASVAGFQPIPNFAVYSATKSYVISLSEAIAEELRDSGVTVSALCPGPTRSDFFTNADMDLKLMKMAKFMSRQDVAEEGIRGLMSGESIITPGARNKMGAFGAKWLPKKTVMKITKSVMSSSRGQ